MAILLSDALVELVHTGVSIVVATVDAAGRPECVRGLGVVVAPDRRSLTTFVNAKLAERITADLANNGRIAVLFTRIIDMKSVQLKGRSIEVRPAHEAESAISERYLAAFAEALSYAGQPCSVTRTIRLRPALAISLEVETLFHQTPGPGAGRRVEAFE